MNTGGHNRRRCARQSCFQLLHFGQCHVVPLPWRERQAGSTAQAEGVPLLARRQVGPHWRVLGLAHGKFEPCLQTAEGRAQLLCGQRGVTRRQRLLRRRADVAPSTGRRQHVGGSSASHLRGQRTPGLGSQAQSTRLCLIQVGDGCIHPGRNLAQHLQPSGVVSRRLRHYLATGQGRHGPQRESAIGRRQRKQFFRIARAFQFLFALPQEQGQGFA